VCDCLEMWRGTMGFADGWIDGRVADFFVSRLLLHLLLCLRTRKNKTQYEIHERVCFKVFLSSLLHLLFCLCLKIGCGTLKEL